MPIKTCSECGEAKDISQFYIQRRKGQKPYPYARCKACFNRVQAVGYVETKGKRYALKKADKKKNPEKFDGWNRAHLLRKYGLTSEDYNKILEKQNGCCAVCLRPPLGKRLAVDHDHSTLRVRGLLCAPCNRALGFFRGEVASLQRAISYLTICENKPG